MSNLLKSKVQDWSEKFAACEVQINAGSSVDLDAEQLPEPWNTLQFLEENNLFFTYFPEGKAIYFALRHESETVLTAYM